MTSKARALRARYAKALEQEGPVLAMRIALDAQCDPKTVSRYLLTDQPLRPSTRTRIEAALERIAAMQSGDRVKPAARTSRKRRVA